MATPMTGRIHKSLTVWLLVMVATAAHGRAASPADDQFAVAAQHYTHQRWQLAATEFRTFVESFSDHPRVPEAYFYWGESLAQLRQDDEAIKQLQRFLQLAPQHALVVRAHFRIGELAYLSERPQLALEHLTPFLKQAPNDALAARARLYKAACESKIGNSATATQDYRQIIQEHPESTEAHAARMGLADQALTQSQIPTAIGLLQFVARQGPEGLRQAAQAKLARCHMSTGNIGAAEKLWNHLLDSPGAAHRRVESLIGVAECQAARQDWDAVESTLSKLPSSVPSSWQPAVAGLRALIAVHRGNTTDIEGRMDTLLQRFPQSPWTVRALWDAAQRCHRDRRDKQTLVWLDHLRERDLSPEERARARSLTIQSLLRLARWEDVVQLASERAEDQLALAAAQLALRDYQSALATTDRLRTSQSDITEEARRVARAIRGMALVGAKRFAEATAVLEPLADKIPDGVDRDSLRAALATAYIATKDWEAAGNLLTRWTNQVDKPSEAYQRAVLELADALAADGSRTQAARWYRVILDSDNDQLASAALSGLAWASYGGSGNDESSEYFAELLRKYPNHPAAPQAALLRGQALKQQQRPREALAMFDLVLDRYGDSKSAAQALLLKAQTHRSLGETDSARESLDQLLGQFPHSEFAPAAWYELGWLAQQNDDRAAAREAFGHICQEFPESQVWADATYRLARLLVHEQRLQDAQARLSELTRDRSRAQGVWSHAWFLRGQLHGREGDWIQCRHSMQQVLDSTNSPSLSLAAEYWRAEAAYRLGDWAKAKQEFDALIDEHRTGEHPAWWPRVWLRRAQILAHEELWNETLEALQEIRKRFPDFREPQEVHYLVGRCQLGRGKFTEARAAWQQAIESSQPPRSETAAMAQWMIGESYFLQRDYDAAIRAYLRVDALYPYPTWQAAALLQTGKCYEMKGQWPQAIRTYQQILDTLPQTSYRDEAEKRLRVARQRNSDAPIAR